jgi:uncharacterized protein
MEESNFEWDENKSKSNLQKHGVDFVQARLVFEDENRIETVDDRVDYGETRYKVVGKAIDLILSVIFTIRGFAIRIISARAASKKEREEYNKK